MKRLLLWLPLAVLALSACRQDTAALPDPVEMTPETVGFYCQMALLEHDGPQGQIHLDGMPAPLFFSQVKDAVAYLHMPEQSHAVVATYVQDMTGATWQTPGPWVEVSQAVYVIESDARGGMDAPEFVPFSDPTAAAEFAAQHGGRVLAYGDITAGDVLTAAPEPAENTEPDDMAARLKSLARNQGN